MSYTFTKKIAPKGLKNNPNADLRGINYITIHNTGMYASSATAAANANWVYGGSLEQGKPKQSSWHYTVDNKEIYQTFEDTSAC